MITAKQAIKLSKKASVKERTIKFLERVDKAIKVAATDGKNAVYVTFECGDEGEVKYKAADELKEYGYNILITDYSFEIKWKENK